MRREGWGRPSHCLEVELVKGGDSLHGNNEPPPPSRSNAVIASQRSGSSRSSSGGGSGVTAITARGGKSSTLQTLV